MGTWPVVVFGGVIIAISWVIVIKRGYYLAPLAFLAFRTTYVLAVFTGSIWYITSRGEIDPVDMATAIIKIIFKQTIVFVLVFSATIAYILYVSALL